MAKYLKRREGISVSHNFIHELWQENDLKPHLQGTFKVSKDPGFSAKVVDIVGLYLDPPDGAVVLSIDEKTQVQALERTQPLLPADFGKPRSGHTITSGMGQLTCSLRWKSSPAR
jgi:hypothetical protein